jgi:hypothetical protein
MKYKSGAEWVNAFGVVFDEMTAKGFRPKLQTMDNEASAALKKYFTEKEMNYHLFPPHCHITNAAEELSELSRSISKLASPQLILISLHTCGTGSCPKQKSH